MRLLLVERRKDVVQAPEHTIGCCCDRPPHTFWLPSVHTRASRNFARRPGANVGFARTEVPVALASRKTSGRIVGLSGQSLPDVMVWLACAPRREFWSNDWRAGQDVCGRHRRGGCGEKSRAHAETQ